MGWERRRLPSTLTLNARYGSTQPCRILCPRLLSRGSLLVALQTSWVLPIHLVAIIPTPAAFRPRSPFACAASKAAPHHPPTAWANRKSTLPFNSPSPPSVCLQHEAMCPPSYRTCIARGILRHVPVTIHSTVNALDKRSVVKDQQLRQYTTRKRRSKHHHKQPTPAP